MFVHNININITANIFNEIVNKQNIHFDKSKLIPNVLVKVNVNSVLISVYYGVYAS